MNKVFQIARYDFKRIAFNPITLIGYAVVLVVCLILGFAYDIPNTPTYSAKLSGQTTNEVYSTFSSSDNRYDTKASLDSIFADAKHLIDVHNEQCLEAEELTQINQTFEDIWDEVERFDMIGECSYSTNQNIEEIITASNNLQIFISDFEELEQFHSRLILTESQVETLEAVSEFFSETLSNSSNIEDALHTLYSGKNFFDLLEQVATKAKTFNVDSIHLANFTTDYIETAEAKLQAIYAEMTTLNSLASPTDTNDMDKMESLATNYKLTCESAKSAIENEYKILMDRLSIDIEDLYGYEDFSLEETKLELTLAKYFLEDEDLYYTDYQRALNFNTASYQTTAYDHAYFMMSLIGFAVIIFGIFTAYKLFGLDRRNGRMDLILSQKVTFNQVFAGKFIAVLSITSFCVLMFGLITFVWGAIFYGFLPNGILTVFNLQTVYTISPFAFFLIKLVGIELQAIFYAVFTIFMMNVSRKFDWMFAITLVVFVGATVCNILLNGQLWYCLLPFIHADLTSFLGGATMSSGFLKTSLYAYGNFFISLIYFLVVVGLLYNFTKQLFKKN